MAGHGLVCSNPPPSSCCILVGGEAENDLLFDPSSTRHSFHRVHTEKAKTLCKGHRAVLKLLPMCIKIRLLYGLYVRVVCSDASRLGKGKV